MEDPGVDCRSEEVVGDGDCVDVPGEVEVEFLHGNHLMEKREEMVMLVP